MPETLLNMVMVLAGSILGIFLQKKLSPPLQEQTVKGTGLFILAIGLRVFLRYHQPVLVLVSLMLGLGLGTWWKLGDRVTKLGMFLLKFILEKHLFVPPPSGFNEAFAASSLLFCVGSLSLLGGFPGDAHHALWSVKLALAFFPAAILAATLGWGVMFSVFILFIVQVVMSLSGDSVQSFFTDNIVADLTGVGGLLIALWGLKISRLTNLGSSDFLPALLVSPLVSWAYYSLLNS